ncbi:MAG TPA: DNA translocase FtsK 4TM domain-containing protein [Clostridia bacterium]|nr:DNA translocase FtsK 4TM domain-containing protein [Clostridia bacterium]
MAKRKAKSKKRTIKNRENKRLELIGVIIIGLGLFALLSVYTTSAGTVGIHFNKMLKGLFGIVAYIVPPFIILLGILIIMSYHKTLNKLKLGLTILFIFLSFQLIHLIYINEFNRTGFLEFIIDSYNQGIDVKGAGALFTPLVYFVYKWFGIMGSYLLLIVLFIMDLLMLTKLSLKQLGIDIFGRISKKKLELINRASKKEEQNLESKDFIGETIEIDDGSNVDPQHLKEAFHKEEDLVDNQQLLNNQDSIDDDLEIIEYNKGNKKLKTPSESSSGDMDSISVDSTILRNYPFPPMDLLKKPTISKASKGSSSRVRSNAKLLEDTLMSFGISAKVNQVSKGPAITRYELQPAPGVKVSRIVNLSDDIALNLAASGVRIEAPIPGKAAVGVEVPNDNVTAVFLREVLESKTFQNHPSKLNFALGKDVAGKAIVADISRMPHLLIAGATGSGKSVCINGLIVSIIFKYAPEDVKLILIDPKVVELIHFNGIPHLLVPVVTDPKKAAGALNWAVQEMVSRYKLFADTGVKDLHSYNEKIKTTEEAKLPQIIVVVDELADLMMVAPGDVEDAICRLAQMARAAGIHLVIATQRPSVDVITGLIKANIPSRIAFAVSSHTDSRTILDMGGAEKLLGRGDMLFYPVGASKPIRVQGCFVSEKEIQDVVEHIKNHNENPTYDMDVIEEIAAGKESPIHDEQDELLPDAIEVIMDAGQASISMLQRRLRVGYARAARMIDEMEVRGIVSGFDGSKPRNVLLTKEEFEELYK